MTTTRVFSPPGRIDGMSRRGIGQPVFIAADIDDCDPMDVSQVADLGIEVPAGVTSLTFHNATSLSGTYGAIEDWQGNAATINTTGKAGMWITFPPMVFPYSFLKIQSAGADALANVASKT